MAFSHSITRRVRNVIGDRDLVYGKFGGDVSTGSIETGLKQTEWMVLQGTASAAGSANIAVVTTNFPLTGSVAIHKVDTTGKGGIWVAYGKGD